MTNFKFGDITQAGHRLKLKNIFGVAKALSKGEIASYFYRAVNELHFRQSLLFWYKLDED